MAAEADFRAIYDANATAVHSYFCGRTGGQAAAADLTQDLFLRAWQHLPELLSRNADGQRAWLFTVARNLVIDAARRSASRRQAEEVLRAEPEPQAPAAGDRVMAAEQVAVVGRAISALPEDLRVVLTMAAAGALTSAEIGAALDLPAGTVRYRLSRARTAVAAALAAEGAVEPATAVRPRESVRSEKRNTR